MENEAFWFAIVLACGLAGVLVVFGLRRYHHAINPLFLFSIFDIGLMTLVSALVANGLYDGQKVGLTAVLYLSIVHLVGFFLVFLPRRFHLPRRFFNTILNAFGKNAGSTLHGGVSQLFLLMLMLGLFFLLMRVSGGEELWLIDPRLAYMSYRAGAGFIYVMVQWMLLLSLLYYLWTRKPGLAGLIVGVCLYSFGAYFTGSKSNLLSGIILAGVYYNFFMKKIHTLLILLSPIFMMASLLMLLLLQGSYDSVFMAISYFRDYTETTAKFLMRFDEFGLQWGNGMLSDLWFYVPRALYPAKPFEYGTVLIHQVLFPGAAEQGYTPGILPWALSYLDFGSIGVFLAGVTTGIVRRGVYESFLVNKSNIFAFLLMVHLSLVPVFAYATLPMIFIIGILLIIFMKRRIVFSAFK